jgi:hypothetical protein
LFPVIDTLALSTICATVDDTVVTPVDVVASAVMFTQPDWPIAPCNRHTTVPVDPVDSTIAETRVAGFANPATFDAPVVVENVDFVYVLRATRSLLRD